MGTPLPHPAASDIRLDQVLSALSDPVRREVLARIASEGPKFCGDLDFHVSKSTMSYHFRVLRESGLMHTEVVGNHRRITRRDDLIETTFPGLLTAVDLPSNLGCWSEESET
ncbi:ArsR/SmtB family transcription factor [Mycetocola saprophilus]|uniref:ArsR/SmtB family transcription factor n=1 Tax=Mycetocola saprophilus TaxID=76636 RepID=UPI0009DE479A|nr:helix-turn-helix domain-containing protein [Mycetocola saprophilus]